MDKKISKQILKRFDRLEARVNTLEQKTLTIQGQSTELPNKKSKTLTLPELIRDKKFENGQQKITVIVGYFEKIKSVTPIKERDIKEGWQEGKFEGRYNPNLLSRANRDGLIRDLSKLDGDGYDLSQSGERFFEEFLKQESKSE